MDNSESKMNSSLVNNTQTTTDVSLYSAFDYETEDFPNSIWYTKGKQVLLTNIAIFIPVCVIGLTGNFWVIYVLKSNKHIRTPTNLILGNMAIADMICTLVYPCFLFVYDYFQNYQLGIVGCKGEGSIECTTLIASVISMSAITYDRLTAIVLPSDTRIDKCKAKVIICATWLIGMALSLPLAFLREYKERKWKNFDETYCMEEVIVVNIYWYVIITALVWLPLTIQLICYGAIFVKLNKYEKIIVKAFNHHQLGYKKSAAKMMFIVILIFMICRLPYTAFIIYRHQQLKSKKFSSSMDVTNSSDGLYHSLWFSSKYMLIVNAALNPLIYSFTNVSFRNAFRRTKLYRWKLIYLSKFHTKPANTKQENHNNENTKRNNIFYIFKRHHIKSTQCLEPSTKVVEIFNTKL